MDANVGETETRPEECLCVNLDRSRHVFSAFDNGDPIKDFITLLTHNSRKTPQHDIICLAHNGSNYDTHLVQARLLDFQITPSVTMKGLKLFKLVSLICFIHLI